MSERDDSTIRPAEWTAETVAAFWDFHSRRDPPGGYFSEVLAEGLIRLGEWPGHMKQGDRVLDYGCGRGPLINALLERGYEVGGVEFSTDSARIVDERFAQSAGYLGTHVPGAEPRWPDAHFDIAYCVEVVEHLTDEFLAPTLQSLANSLRPGGVAIITTPFDEDLPAHQVYCPFCNTEFHHMQHVRSWNVASLSSALTHVGLGTEFCQPVKLARFCYGQPAGRRDKLIALGQWAVRGAIASVSKSAAFSYAASNPGDNLVAIARKNERVTS